MTFDPDNVLMQDSRTRTIPTEQGELVLKGVHDELGGCTAG